MAAMSWEISEYASFNQFTRPTFRNMFEPLNKMASLITNFDRRGIRKEGERLGQLAQKATKKEMGGRKGTAWTTGHWISSNDETYTTVMNEVIEK